MQARMVDEQLQRRVTELIEQRVAEIMASDAVQQSLTQRLQAERQLLEQQARHTSLSRRSLIGNWGWCQQHHVLTTAHAIILLQCMGANIGTIYWILQLVCSH